MEEDTYTTAQAARILKVTDRGVRKMIDRGELEAHQDERGRHLIPQRFVHAMLEERQRLEQLLEEERAERRRLQEQLEAERSRGFWQRLFGG